MDLDIWAWATNRIFVETSVVLNVKNKKKGKGQILIKLSTTPDPGHHMGK